jgi:hypothetical protein
VDLTFFVFLSICREHDEHRKLPVNKIIPNIKAIFFMIMSIYDASQNMLVQVVFTAKKIPSPFEERLGTKADKIPGIIF